MKANFAPLTPLSLLRRSAEVHPERTAIRHGDRSLTYADVAERTLRFASALAAWGVERGDVVSILAPNTPAHVEAHFGVPLAGAVIHSINMRLDPASIAYMLEHAKSRVLLVDEEFSQSVREAIASLSRPPRIVGIADAAVRRDPLGEIEYEAWLAQADTGFTPRLPLSELDPVALNYTSGTTARPKGVVYHHRGAYLNAIGNTLAWPMGQHPVYLWTLPMFHCNGWCFPWTITALAGTHVCLRRPTAGAILAAIREEGVTHLSGAPVILSFLAAAGVDGTPPPRGIAVMTAGAPPPASVIAAVEDLGFVVTHTYGLTEVYGPCVVCEWKDDWNALPAPTRAALKARQGVRYAVQEDVDVFDPVTMTPVAADGAAVGEVMVRGNIVMSEYLHDPSGTAAAFAGGWFHTGDLAAKHPDGYIEIRDRSKDVIISGGENISSIEVEEVLYRHPAVEQVAVVARPDPHWGETPCAFVTLRPGAMLDAAEAERFCRAHLPGFKIPRFFVFGDLPRTATGKVRKNILREQAAALG